MADGNYDAADRKRVGVKRHWEKKCFMQHPPKGYAVASDALPFTMVSFLLWPFLTLCVAVVASHIAAVELPRH